jgi:hypothetical protein
MVTEDDRKLATLQAKHGDKWDVWKVPRTLGPTAWCVKPKGAQIATHNEDSAEALDTWLREQP